MLRLFFTIAILEMIVSMHTVVSCGQESVSRERLETVLLRFPDVQQTDPPVLCYSSGRGHHGSWNRDSNIREIYIWKDGIIAWSVYPGSGARLLSHWYQTTIPVEKVNAVVLEIAESFNNYPVEILSRKRVFMALRIGASYSPQIQVHSPQHHEVFCTDGILWEFYKENKEILQSGDKGAIIETITKIGRFPVRLSNPDGTYKDVSFDMFTYKDMVDSYKRRYPSVGLSGKGSVRLSGKGSVIYSEDEVLQCVELYVAEMEHLLLAEKKILALLPSTEGLEVSLSTVVVQECPCPTSVRSPENEDSEAETGLKSQEDSDSVEAKSE